MDHFNFDEVFEKMMKTKGLQAVVLLAHINPDGDAAGSVMGLAHYIRQNWMQYQVFPYLAEQLDKGPKQVIRNDPFFRPFVQPELSTVPYAVIVCDTSTVERIAGRELYEGAAASLVLDHHASNNGYGDVNYRKISEACAENVFFMVNQERLKDAAKCRDGWNAAKYIYLGIVHDTDGFDRADAGTLEAAAALLQMGVSHKEVMKTLKTVTFEDQCKRTELMRSAVRLMNGKTAYVYVDNETRLKKEIGYEDIHPISGLLRDCEDIELGISFYEEAPGSWRCSFRSDGQWINVNELLMVFGGGGHAGAAGLRIKTDQPKELVRALLDRVKEMRKSR